ncbi:MAG: hypothetical protein RL744_725 [Pseudomonadota bacterium]
MTDKCNPENSEILKAEDPKRQSIDQTFSEKHETTRTTRAAKSKREIMEELSRERFPWEE